MLPNWTYRAEPSWDVRVAGWLGLAASTTRWLARSGCPERLGRPAERLGSPCLAQFGLDWFDLAGLGVLAGSVWLPWLLPGALAGSIWVPTKAPTLSFSIACFVRASTFCLHRILMRRL